MKPNGIRQIYEELLEMHGPQGWWPVTPAGRKGRLQAPVYGIGRINGRQRLEIIFGTVLAQNTQWKPNVERAVIELNRLGLVSVGGILKAEHSKLARAIKSSGYFNQKAGKLKRVAGFLRKHPVSSLRRMKTGELRDLLLGINGVGPETADSIILYALGRPVFVVDAYTRRIFESLGYVKPGASYGEVQRLFMESLGRSPKVFGEYHALIVRHAKIHYGRKGARGSCPLLERHGARG